MSKRPRSPNATRRASFGRAERLRREAGDTRQPKPAAPRKEPAAERPDRQAKQAARPRPGRDPSRHDGPTPLHRIEERLERSRTAGERRRLDRLEKQTRSGFDRAAERRRDVAGRAEHGRKHEALQQKTQRIAEHQRRANLKRLERKRGEMKRAFARTADRRRDAARRIEHDRAKALADTRRQEIQRRAAGQIEREQKRHAEDQKAAQRRSTDEVRTRHKVERNSFRVNENTVMERHHHAIKGIDAREDRELADFDGRRKGLAGRAAELIPGRRAENDQKRADMVRGYESERLTKHRDFEAYKERSFEREMKTLRDQAMERKALMELHRDERTTLTRQQGDERPRLIEDRAGFIDRAEQAHERQQERDRQRDQVGADRGQEATRPSGDFARAASYNAREPVAASRDISRS